MRVHFSDFKKKKVKRLRRSQKMRVRISQQSSPSLAVHRTLNHMYAQVFSSTGGKVLVSVSTLSKDLRDSLAYGGNVESAKFIGKEVALRCLKAGIKKVVFNRSGFKYHGRVKALADAARENGLEF